MVRLALIAMLVSGCLFKPNKLLGNDGGGDDDGSGSGVDAGVANSSPPRVVGKSFWSPISTGSNAGMGPTTYTIIQSGIQDGDLLLLIGNIDNNPQEVTLPAGFTQKVYGEFGADSQTYWVYEKKVTDAASEPVEYSGTYNFQAPAGTSGATTMLLVAIAGASPDIISVSSAANNCFDKALGGACGQRPNVDAMSLGAQTTQVGSVLLYASGVDWFDINYTTAFTPPTDFTMLDAFGDFGTPSGGFAWSTMMVAYKQQDAKTAYPITGTFESSGDRGMPWTVALPIHPDP